MFLLMIFWSLTSNNNLIFSRYTPNVKVLTRKPKVHYQEKRGKKKTCVQRLKNSSCIALPLPTTLRSRDKILLECTTLKSNENRTKFLFRRICMTPWIDQIIFRKEAHPSSVPSLPGWILCCYTNLGSERSIC